MSGCRAVAAGAPPADGPARAPTPRSSAGDQAGDARQGDVAAASFARRSWSRSPARAPTPGSPGRPPPPHTLAHMDPPCACGSARARQGRSRPRGAGVVPLAARGDCACLRLLRQQRRRQPPPERPPRLLADGFLSPRFGFTVAHGALLAFRSGRWEDMTPPEIGGGAIEDVSFAARAAVWSPSRPEAGSGCSDRGRRALVGGGGGTFAAAAGVGWRPSRCSGSARPGC